VRGGVRQERVAACDSLGNGTLYWPIADAMPAEAQNERRLPFAGKRVTATGKVYKQGGSNSIVMKIAEASK
jgi:hypothetical protein